MQARFENLEKVEEKVENLFGAIATEKQEVEKELASGRQEAEQIREEIAQLQEKIVSTISFNFVQEIEDLKKQMEENKALDMMQTKYEIGNLIIIINN